MMCTSKVSKLKERRRRLWQNSRRRLAFLLHWKRKSYKLTQCVVTWTKLKKIFIRKKVSWKQWWDVVKSKTRRKGLYREKRRQGYRGKWIPSSVTMPNWIPNVPVKSIKLSKNSRRAKKQPNVSKKNVILQYNIKRSFHTISRMFQKDWVRRVGNPMKVSSSMSSGTMEQ